MTIRKSFYMLALILVSIPAFASAMDVSHIDSTDSTTTTTSSGSAQDDGTASGRP